MTAAAGPSSPVCATVYSGAISAWVRPSATTGWKTSSCGAKDMPGIPVNRVGSGAPT
ncbi:MAG: hypothetical protein JF621_15905 [Streptomyces turgidiscabies]|nr:hypothetical protein [Streptomyces turgidiscabies]